MDGILPGVRLAARSRIYHSAPHELGRLEYPRLEVLRTTAQADAVRDERGLGMLRPATRCSGTQAIEVAGERSTDVPSCGPAAPRPATPWYANMVVRLECAPGITPEALFEVLMALEAGLGRNRIMENRWGPRVIDIDLLTFGNETRSTPRLALPHPRMAQRPFVLLPLSEIAPEEVPPEIFEGLSFSASDTMLF